MKNCVSFNVGQQQTTAVPKRKYLFIFALMALVMCFSVFMLTACGENEKYSVTFPFREIVGWYNIDAPDSNTAVESGSEYKFTINWSEEVTYYGFQKYIFVFANGKPIWPVSHTEDEVSFTYSIKVTQNTSIYVDCEGLAALHYVDKVSNKVSVFVNDEPLALGSPNLCVNHGDIVKVVYTKKPHYNEPIITVTTTRFLNKEDTPEAYIYTYLVEGKGTPPNASGFIFYEDLNVTCEETPEQYTLGEIPEGINVKKSGVTELSAGDKIYYDEILIITIKDELPDQYNYYLTVNGTEFNNSQPDSRQYRVIGDVTIDFTEDEKIDYDKLSSSWDNENGKYAVYINNKLSYNVPKRIVVGPYYGSEAEILGRGINAGVSDGLLFQNQENLEEVVITEGITYIGSEAFANCKNLKSITLPKSLKEIDKDAFIGCPKLIEIVNKSSLDLQFNSDDNGSVAKNAFAIVKNRYQKGSFEDTVIGGVLYYKNTRLDILVALGFSDPESTAGSITIQDKTVGISGYAFSNCENLSGVSFPNTLQVICDGAFQGSGFKYLDGMPSSVVSIGNGAFSGCRQLRDLYFTEGLKIIEANAFKDCVRLNTITLPKSLESIGDDAFANTDIYEIKNKSNLPLEIGSDSYGGIAKYAYVIEIEDSIYSRNYTECINGINYYISEENNIKAALGLDNLNDKRTLLSIDEGTTTIRRYAFSNSLTGDFEENEYLTEIVIPEGVERIEEHAFDGLYHSAISTLKITLPESLLYLEDYAFKGVGGAEIENIPSHLIYIGDYALPWLANPVELVLPTSITHIGAGAFHGWKVTDLVLHEGLTYLGGDTYLEGAFHQVEGLERVTLPSTLTYLGGYAFRSCQNLKEVIVNSEVIYQKFDVYSDSIGGLLYNLAYGGGIVKIPKEFIEKYGVKKPLTHDDPSKVEYEMSETPDENGYYVFTKKPYSIY